MNLKEYQENAVDSLHEKGAGLLRREGIKRMIFKAPTGSGKTVMVAEFLKKLADDNSVAPFACMWTAPRALHIQSKEKLTVFPVLAEKREQPAGELSGGQRQQVAVGRALMTQPSVLMLDEPTAGVSPIVMDELFDRILEVRKTGVAILMVEQNARQALNIADRGYVLVVGQNRHTDTGAALLANPEVRKSFLGG